MDVPGGLVSWAQHFKNNTPVQMVGIKTNHLQERLFSEDQVIKASNAPMIDLTNPERSYQMISVTISAPEKCVCNIPLEFLSMWECTKNILQDLGEKAVLEAQPLNIDLYFEDMEDAKFYFDYLYHRLIGYPRACLFSDLNKHLGMMQGNRLRHLLHIQSWTNDELLYDLLTEVTQKHIQGHFSADTNIVKSLMHLRNAFGLPTLPALNPLQGEEMTDYEFKEHAEHPLVGLIGLLLNNVKKN